MYMHFEVQRNGDMVRIQKKSNIKLYKLIIFIDNNYIGTMSFGSHLQFNLPTNNPRNITLHVEFIHHGYIYKTIEIHQLTSAEISRMPDSEEMPNHEYMSGDILVASDNQNGLPQGYMGHSAIVIDQESIIEALPGNEIIQKASIESFRELHPNYAHFRPKSQDMGKRAANYAIAYLEKYKGYIKSGVSKPIFHFSLATPLTDEEQYIYCSKLIWLSYYYGADYEIPNDHLWFAPEDIYTSLQKSEEFELIYTHPDFNFKIDL